MLVKRAYYYTITKLRGKSAPFDFMGVEASLIFSTLKECSDNLLKILDTYFPEYTEQEQPIRLHDTGLVFSQKIWSSEDNHILIEFYEQKI